MPQPIRVLVVDDSLLMRKLISRILETEPRIQIVAQVANGVEALAFLARQSCEVITLDMEMPEMGGLEFLRALAQTPHEARVLVLSYLTTKESPVTFEALDLGASDVMHKPSGSISLDISGVSAEMVRKIKEIADEPHMRRVVRASLLAQKVHASVPTLFEPPVRAVKNFGFSERTPFEILCIGSSTGGPQALRAILPQFHADFPLPIVIVQHMSEGFTTGFAETLNHVCEMGVAEAQNGETLKKGRVYIAPANQQLTLERRGGALTLCLSQAEKVSGHRPSVDVLFQSAAQVCGPKTMAVIMTGMGSDGAKGLAAIRKAGGFTVGQSQKTCVVYGMPRVAEALGAVVHVEDLDKIYSRLASGLGAPAGISTTS